MSVSLCVLRIEVDDDLPEMADIGTDNESAKEQKIKDRGARESKTITVETYASVLLGSNEVTGILPTSSRRSPPEGSIISEDDETISFFCGNPLLEVTKGVLHLYKENELKESTEAKTLCLLSIPGALGARDLLAFAAACQQDIAHVRVLRDGSPDHYMALLTFRTSSAAQEFHSAFDGVPYSILEPGCVCRAAWVSRVEWARSGSPPATHTELPICPVCLERMDESVAGVLSVQCAHSFHAECLVRWRDARCPVCRAAQTPEPSGGVVCALCQSNTDEGVNEESRDISGVAEGLPDGVDAGTLWICLICGNIGCGRYEGGHAAQHFVQSNHTYALQLGSNRVWDYAGDNFVHRLVQNKTDGKLVAAEGGLSTRSDCEAEQKLEAAQLEFTYILTTQLESQREYYQLARDKMESDHKAECEKLNTRASNAEKETAQLKKQIETLNNTNKNLEKKLFTVTNKLATLQGDFNQERDLASAMASSQAEWQSSAKEREESFVREVSELKEQLRDVMFFVEARGRLETAEGVTSEEVAGASVSVQPPPKPRRRRR